MNVLILNLTRMGDIIQSTPLMSGLKKRFSGVHITCVVNRGFADICSLMPFIDELIVFDLDECKRRLISDSNTLIENYRFVKGWVDQINRRSYDLLINLTPSKECAILSSLVDVKEIKGLTIDRDGYRIIKDPWMQYFTISVFNRKYNPFNIVDMYKMAGGVIGDERRLLLELTGDIRKRADSILSEMGVEEGDILIGLQPGASKEHKRWTVEGFSGLSKMLLKDKRCKLLVFGTKGERYLGKALKESVGEGLIDLTGKTTLLELVGLVERCALLVTNDSGTMHIATAVGTRVVELSLGAAYFRETGPYGDGHIVIKADIPCHPCRFNVECKEMVCRHYISARTVYEVVRGLLDGEEDISKKDPDIWKGVDVYRSVIDEDGFVDYLPVILRERKKEDIILNFYREMWKRVLYREKRYLPCADIYRDAFKFNLDKEIRALKYLEGLAEEGIESSKEIIHIYREMGRNGYKRLNILDKRLASLDEDIERMGNLYTFLQPITDIFRYGKEGIIGDDILTIAGSTYKLYYMLKKEVRTMIEIISRYGLYRSDIEHCKEEMVCIGDLAN